MAANHLQLWNNAIFDSATDKENRSPFRPSKAQFKSDNIDADIQNIEREIKRLSSQLAELKLEKAQQLDPPKARIVPARFMEQSHTSGFSLGLSEVTPLKPPRKPVEETPGKGRSRGLSLGPLAITSLRRKSCVLRPQIGKEEKEKKGPVSVPRRVDFGNRGVSLGPLEIASAVRIRENDVKKIGGLTVGPKHRRQPLEVADMRKGVATDEPKKTVKKEGDVRTSLRPKVLFQEEDKKNYVLPTKRAMKGRIVSSRYSLVNQSPANKRRKWSLPELKTNEKDGLKGKFCQTTDYDEGQKTVSGIISPPELLPRIRTCRSVAESPRDSGPAKRVADLIGRRTHFGEILESSFYQKLRFEEELQQQESHSDDK